MGSKEKREIKGKGGSALWATTYTCPPENVVPPPFGLPTQKS